MQPPRATHGVRGDDNVSSELVDVRKTPGKLSAAVPSGRPNHTHVRVLGFRAVDRDREVIPRDDEVDHRPVGLPLNADDRVLAVDQLGPGPDPANVFEKRIVEVVGSEGVHEHGCAVQGAEPLLIYVIGVGYGRKLSSDCECTTIVA